MNHFKSSALTFESSNTDTTAQASVNCDNVNLNPDAFDLLPCIVLFSVL